MSTNIAFYLRLSMSDGDLGKNNKVESNSIENQRMILQSYVDANDELVDGIVEYIDDGYSGTNFNRPSFKRMIEDAKKGKIHTIIVKDLSRLGRDYIVVGEYIEQIFPLLEIRFIAVNSNYDSKQYIGRTMGLDMALSNLSNDFYSKDLSRKMKSALRTRWKQGCSTSGRLPYGYVKNQVAKGGWQIDLEAAKVVKLIFEKANEGWSTSMIAEHLNEQKIVTPSVHREAQNQYGGRRKVPSTECLWDGGKIRTILNRYEYTGAFVHHYRQSIQVGSKITRAVPKNERYIIEDGHDAIVTREEFENAQVAIQIMKKPQYKIPNEYPLKGKLRCGVCRLAMSYLEKSYGQAYYCSHKSKTGKYSQCCSEYIPTEIIEKAVWNILYTQLKILHELSVKIEPKKGVSSQNMVTKCKCMEKDIATMKAERIRQYEAYAEGIITREQYLLRKTELTEQIQKIQETLQRFWFVVEKDKTMTEEIIRINEQANEQMIGDKLTKKMVDTFIETVYVYDSKTIEVQFVFDDLLQEAIQKYA